MFKLSTVGLDTRLESHAPFFHCLVHDALIKSTPLFHKTLLQMIDIVYATSIHSLLKHTPDLVVDWIKVWAVRRPVQSKLSRQ